MNARVLDFLVGVPLVFLGSFFGRKEPPPGSISRILVIKLAAIGDAILLIPVLQQLRKAFPSARIDWLCSPINESVARQAAGVDELIVKRSNTPVELWRLAKKLRARRYDAVIDAEQWARGTAILSFLSGAPVRCGFDTPGQHRAGLFTRTEKKTFSRHEIDEFTALFAKLGPVDGSRSLSLKETDAGRRELEDKVPEIMGVTKRPLVLIHPGCGEDGLPREWPLERYAAIGKALEKDYSALLLLSAGPDDQNKTKNLNNLLDGKAVDLGGRLSLEGSFSLVNRADLVISGNTGIMHIAAALGKPQVAIHGPTNPLLWGPLNPKAIVIQTNCQDCPCLKLGFEYHRRDGACMERITVDEVKKAADRLLGAQKLPVR